MDATRLALIMQRWKAIQYCAALSTALIRTGRKPAEACALAEEVVGGIQGALVPARALDRPGIFADSLQRIRARLSANEN